MTTEEWMLLLLELKVFFGLLETVELWREIKTGMPLLITVNLYLAKIAKDLISRLTVEMPGKNTSS